MNNLRRLDSVFRVLSRNDLYKVHESSIRILEETGVIFQSEEVLKIFKKHGAKVEGETVYIPTKMVEDSLASCPKSYTWLARNKKRSVRVGSGQDELVISPSQGPVYVQDIDAGRRKGTMHDYINLLRLCQESSVVNSVGAIPVEPNDIDEKEKYLKMTYELLKNTDKPMIGMILTEKEQRDVFDMIEIAVGQKGFLLDNQTICVSVNPLSPLRYGLEQLETVLAYAKHRQPVFILPCIMAGATGPISLYGMTILQNTEILAGMVLTQLINPGTPVVYSPASSMANMKNASYITGSPEGNLINIACIQMGLELYNVPTRSMAGLTDAKEIDCQAGIETMQNIFMLVASGVNIINECVGVLDSIMTVSYEKFVIDEEILSRVLRIMNGMDTYNQIEAEEVIKEVGHSGAYLAHQSTFDHFRKCWKPTVSTWDTYSDWKEKGAQDIVEKANEKYKEILNKPQKILIDSETDKDLQAYIEKTIKNT